MAFRNVGNVSHHYTVSQNPEDHDTNLHFRDNLKSRKPFQIYRASLFSSSNAASAQIRMRRQLRILLSHEKRQIAIQSSFRIVGRLLDDKVWVIPGCVTVSTA